MKSASNNSRPLSKRQPRIHVQLGNMNRKLAIPSILRPCDLNKHKTSVRLNMTKYQTPFARSKPHIFPIHL
jgi:hypothetical protein